MNTEEKDFLKAKFGYCIKKIILDNKASKTLTTSDKSISSLRKLAAASEVEFAIIQKVVTGQKNPAFTTIYAIIDGLGLSLSEFFKIFESIDSTEFVEK